MGLHAETIVGYGGARIGASAWGRKRMDGGTLLETFRSPPARYGPAPLLVFNDEHEGVAGEERITKVLEGHERATVESSCIRGPVS
jgi:hypothetical protein